MEQENGAIYCRLSQDDGSAGESGSIQTQKTLLTQYCKEHGIHIADYASILGYVGAGGLGLIMNEKIGWREYDSLGMILIVLFVAVMVIEGISHALRKRLT